MTSLDPKEDCVSVNLLARYYSGLLDETAADTLEGHLFSCEACQSLADRMADLAQASLEEMHFAKQPLAFLSASPIALELNDRVRRWIQVGSEMAAKVRVAAQSISYSLKGLESVMNPATPFQLALASAGTRAAGESQEPIQGAILTVPGSDGLTARIVVELRRKRITVQIDSFPERLDPPLVALRPQHGETVIRQMQRLDPLSGEPGVVDCFAEFELVDAAEDVMVLIEPIQHG